jgi:hypothetical protein
MSVQSASGYILATPAAVEISRDILESTKAFREKGPTLHYRDSYFALKRWDEYRLISPIPLADEPEGSRKAYEYSIYIIRGFGKIILLADRRRVAEYVITNIVEKRIFPNFRKVPIYLDRLIDFCREPASEFLITSLYGRFSRPGRQLRTMSLFGDDVTDSELFKQNSHLFNFYQCGLGRRLFDGLPSLRPNEEGEIARVGNDGFVMVNLGDRRRATEFMRVVSFVLRNRWVDGWVPSSEDD